MSATLTKVEMMRIALAEINPSIEVYEPYQRNKDRGATYRYSGVSWVDQSVTRAARRLIEFRLHGPEVPVRCDKHEGINAFDLWAQCRKVRVVDALLGRTCTDHPVNP